MYLWVFYWYRWVRMRLDYYVDYIYGKNSLCETSKFQVSPLKYTRKKDTTEMKVSQNWIKSYRWTSLTNKSESTCIWRCPPPLVIKIHLFFGKKIYSFHIVYIYSDITRFIYSITYVFTPSFLFRSNVFLKFIIYFYDGGWGGVGGFGAFLTSN